MNRKYKIPKLNKYILNLSKSKRVFKEKTIKNFYINSQFSEV